MGTGFVSTTKLSPEANAQQTILSPIVLSTPLSQPDLLTDHNRDRFYET
jgi:hypothetical protein